MVPSLHPAAPAHLPVFITAPGETDVLMAVMTVAMALAVLALGLIFLRIHTLPERIAHKSQKLQFEIVAVLGLIALFTHMHIFWVAGLLLALIDLPDFGGRLDRIAGSLETMATKGKRGFSTDTQLAADAQLAANARHSAEPQKDLTEPHKDLSERQKEIVLTPASHKER